MHALLTGKSPDHEAAVKLAYLEILTRRPTPEELAEGKEIIDQGATPLDGMADLRWVTSREFLDYDFPPADEKKMSKLLGLVRN